MEERVYLYRLTNLINSKTYFGITNAPNHRIKAHLRGADKTPIQRALSKYGIDNFKHEILCIGNREYITNLEIIAIEKFKSTVSNNGYNITLGGDGVQRYDWSKIDHLVGTMQDSDLAKITNISKSMIQVRRIELGIPSFFKESVRIREEMAVKFYFENDCSYEYSADLFGVGKNKIGSIIKESGVPLKKRNNNYNKTNGRFLKKALPVDEKWMIRKL